MDSRPIASLSASLLARKGAARPAMRRPHSGSFPVPTLPLSVQEDLGWNDMGEDHEPDAPALMVVRDGQETHPASVEEAATLPAPVEQRVMLEEALAPSPDRAAKGPRLTPPSAKGGPKKAASKKAAPAAAKALAVDGVKPRQTRAAFTLRLDPDRHLRLRLACALSGRSAQQIVTDALETFLSGQPQLEALAGQVPALQRKGKGKSQ